MSNCLAQEWHRDGRGLWAMKTCQFSVGHKGAHGFGAWQYDVAPPASGVEASGPLRALIAQWRNRALVNSSPSASSALNRCADELDALLSVLIASAPVAQPDPPRDPLAAAITRVVPSVGDSGQSDTRRALIAIRAHVESVTRRDRAWTIRGTGSTAPGEWPDADPKRMRD